jgi:hypothetical protein
VVSLQDIPTDQAQGLLFNIALAESIQSVLLCNSGQRILRISFSVVLSGYPMMCSMLLLIILLVILFGSGGGYYGYSRWGSGGGIGIVGLVLVVFLVFYVSGGAQMGHIHL